ncbi:hypothetical protein BU24DRAFT_429398 [Aaosphaeria arxii CBS 175.79]|uniref:Uncharacterized protein n=1 Tax=Aaosphaeria arxii CBS 175.79 TaxID=1450172 RepID=A0A6A5X5U5_9PLEO|nr:uncharacterized protein BU24DRAFT_429474 [Aaosphaeria arxii CBS 175.79]XP_033376704.1 uncharacterized protein BU24DRAFT_429398 [Aaosphaeria arxii CBS 175.79]KAF2008312.1 hypothetical protein BU24DRAFT_429474 [Aaosphaeria arxii CBS 175.79]KAF2008365.1 hypothetical protein BU24DRAFT_429398 [Aaosphaeria arxii CBS 175.79]
MQRPCAAGAMYRHARISRSAAATGVRLQVCHELSTVHLNVYSKHGLPSTAFIVTPSN